MKLPCRLSLMLNILPVQAQHTIIVHREIGFCVLYREKIYIVRYTYHIRDRDREYKNARINEIIPLILQQFHYFIFTFVTGFCCNLMVYNI